jgi:DNA-binding winged helix-turn-helix (wHTH) protein/tetratricopeptide (TPR) repeat protein
MVRHQKFVFAEFSFDCVSGELKRHGRCLRIPDQTARLLALLLSANGDLITREQIRQKLWPDGEHLDHDHSINKAISQLRAILRDNRQSPKLLETIPKRGYRFLRALAVVEPDDEMQVDVSDRDAPSSLNTKLPQSVAAVAVAGDNHRRSAKRLWQVAALLIAVLATIGGYFYIKSHPRTLTVARVAITPFDVSGQDSGEGAGELAESLRMDLANAISQLPEVQVRAAHSIQSSKSDADTVRNVARTLQVDVLIYSHLTLDASHFVLHMEMIRGEDAAHMASFRYEGSRSELLSLRSKVQRDVFSHLSLTQRSEQHALGSTNDANAYEAYLLGRSLLEQRTDDSLRKASVAFKSSAAADPHFSGAYAGMAHAEMILAEHEAIPVAEGYQKTREFAQKALAEASTSSEAHALLGYSAFRLDWNFNEAERELRQAIELDPSESVYHVWYSVLLCDEGRFDESFRQIDLAHSLDPLWAPIYLTEAFLGSSSRHYDRMLSSAKRLVELMPDWPLAHDQMAWTLWFAGRSEEAVTEWRKMAEIEKDTARVEFEKEGALALQRGGRKAYAQLRLNACGKRFAAAHGNDFVVAEWSAYAGLKNDSLKLLEQEVARHSQYALEITVIPAYFDYHSDPRFQRMAMRIGLPLSNPRV